MADRSTDSSSNKLLTPEENLVEKADPLYLSIPDAKLVEIMDKRIEESKTFFKSQKRLTERQDTNREYVMGKQWDQKQSQSNSSKYAAPYMDNIIYESEATIKPLALGRLPDLTVKPGNNTDQAKQDADDLTKVFTDEMKRREERQVLSLSFKHIPVYYIGAIKPVWNPEKGPLGDYEFTVIHPKLLIIDSTANTLDTTKHKILGNYYPLTVKEVLMRFPKKEEDLLKELGIDPKEAKKFEKSLASTIKITELHFTWYDKVDSKWERIDGVLWKFKKTLLGKMKDPNWDWEGEDRLFEYDISKMDKQNPTQDHLKDALLFQNGNIMPGMPQMPMLDGQQPQYPQGIKTEKVYHNHFQSPRKPYILLGYDQWGEMVYDETSRIEQVIPMQDNVNMRGKQITDIANRVRGKDIFSLASGLKKKDIENLDMSDPNTDILVKGNPREVHEHIEGEQPKPALFQDQAINRERLFSIMGTHDSTRGIKQGKGKHQEQALIQQDFGRIQDLSEDTVNYAAEQMADWRLQFIKLRYTVDHFKSVFGKEGETIFFRVNRDMIHDNMSVIATASGVDKMMRKQEAYAKLKAKAIDPLTFFEDIDDPNPKQRAERLFFFMKNPDMWYEKFVKGASIADMAAKLGGLQPGTVGSPPLSGANNPTPGGLQPTQQPATQLPV